jgi:hypothetical protein
MKKLVLIGVMMVAVARLSHATSIVIVNTTNMSPNYLDGADAYQYDVAIAAGTQIASASLTYNLTLHLAGPNPNVVFSDLINTTSKTGSFAPGAFSTGEPGYDIFQHLSTYSSISDSLTTSATFTQGETIAWTYNFTGTTAGTSLYDLQQDVFNDGFFDLGIDPNCEYQGLITFNYTVSSGGGQGSVPDHAMTVCLLGMSFLGMVVFRRKLALN